MSIYMPPRETGKVRVDGLCDPEYYKVSILCDKVDDETLDLSRRLSQISSGYYLTRSVKFAGP